MCIRDSSDDYKPFYRNEGDANLTDISYQIGLGEITVPFLSWGDAFLDYDNDGWKDLLMSDGHVYPCLLYTSRLSRTASSSPPSSISTATKCKARVTIWSSFSSHIGAGRGIGSTAGNECIVPFSTPRGRFLD